MIKRVNNSGTGKTFLEKLDFKIFQWGYVLKQAALEPLGWVKDFVTGSVIFGFQLCILLAIFGVVLWAVLALLFPQIVFNTKTYQ